MDGTTIFLQFPYFMKPFFSFIKCVVLTGSSCGPSQLPVAFRKPKEGREEICHRAFRGAIPLTQTSNNKLRLDGLFLLKKIPLGVTKCQG